MSKIGKISKIGIEKILKWAVKGEKTGVFVFSRRNEKKYLYFKNGKILTASSNITKERLGQIMLRNKMISQEQIENIQNLQREKKIKFGKAVLSLKYATQKQLIETLHKQTEEIILNLFDWNDGEFLFYLNKLPSVEFNSAQHNLDLYIQKGLERLSKWKDIRSLIPTIDVVLDISFNVPNGQSENNYSSEEFKIMTLVDGISSVFNIIENSELTEFETMKILYNLLKSRHIVIKNELLDEKDEEKIEQLSEPTDIKVLASTTTFTNESNFDLNSVKNELEALMADKKFPQARSLLKKHLTDEETFDKESVLVNLVRLEVTALENIPFLREDFQGEKIKELKLDHRAAFILTRIDGKINLKFLSNISGFPKDTVKEIIYNLFIREIIEIISVTKPEITETLENSNKEKTKIQDEANDINNAILEKYQNIVKQNYYEILEIDININKDDIKKAYRNLVKKFHPDMIQGVKDDNILNAVNIVFDKIQLAYNTLIDPEKRENYDKAKGLNLTEEEQKKLTRLKAKAGLQYQIGMKASKSRNYKKAIEFIKSAIDINPTEAIYYGVLADIFSKNPKWYKQAEETIKKAIDVDPHNAMFYITYGKILLKRTQIEQAEIYFQKALMYDPGNEDAISELRKMGKDIKKDENPYDKIISKDIALL